MNEMLSIEHLNKSFGGIAPIRDVTFSVSKQTILLITGENGAGKTTLFNLIAGLEKPTSGNITYNGTSIEAKAPLQISRLGIARLYQQPRLFRNLLVWENLASAAHHNIGEKVINLIIRPNRVRQEDDKLKDRAIDLLTKFGLQGLSNLTAGELSYGQQKLVSFCMIAMNGTQLALLDEPFAGLNPQNIEQLSEMILQMRSGGVTFLIIEHNINKALAIAGCHLEMKDGVVRMLRAE